MRVDGAVTYDVSAGPRRQLRRHDRRRLEGLLHLRPSSSPPTTPTPASTSTCGARRPTRSPWSRTATTAPATATAARAASTPARQLSTSAASSPTPQLFYCQLDRAASAATASPTTSIASESGDIYFFSPEQLDGSRGIPNQENLYVYRNGAGPVRHHPHHRVRSASNADTAIGDGCSDTPIARMQVSPDGSHMAFVTASQVTQYDNAGHLEMYTYEPVDRRRSSASPASRAARRRPPTSRPARTASS